MGSKSLKRIGAGIATLGASEVARPLGFKSEKLISKDGLKRGGIALATGGLSETVNTFDKGSKKLVDKITPKFPDPNDFLPDPNETTQTDVSSDVDRNVVTVDDSLRNRRSGRRSSVLTRRRGLTTSSTDTGAATLG